MKMSLKFQNSNICVSSTEILHIHLRHKSQIPTNKQTAATLIIYQANELDQKDKYKMPTLILM
jgi:hypothetical protein